MLDALQQDQTYVAVRALVRKPQSFVQSKVEPKLVNFNDQESVKMAIDGSDAVFCAVGTTQKKVKGDKVAYRKVDYDIPVQAARFCAETGCPNFLLVSSVGADSHSKNFYLKLKGEVEDAVRQQAIRSVSIFRPSILLGKRKENRPAEKLGQSVMSFFAFVLVGNWEKYRPIDAERVAEAMVSAAKKAKSGATVYEYEAMRHL